MSEKKQNNLHLTVGQKIQYLWAGHYVRDSACLSNGRVRRTCDHCFNYWD